MRILKNIFLLLMLVAANMTSAQLITTAEGGEAAMGSNLEVDVIVDEFTDLTAFEFHLVWDSLVMTFVEIKNVNSDLPAYFASTNFGLPGDGSIKDGTITTSWFNQVGTSNLAAGSRLFTAVLNSSGAECATSSIDFDNLEAGGVVFGEQVMSTGNGSNILVSGPNCGNGGGGDPECVNECAGSTNVILSMPCITAPAGDNICIPITVSNFNNIEAVQAGILWDPTVMEYTGSQNLGFSDPAQNGGFLFNEMASDMGMVRQFWSEVTGSTPQTLPDGTVLYELCFDLIGDDGDVISIDFGDIGNFGVEIVQSGVAVDFCLDQGTITIGDPPVDAVELIVNTASGLQNTEACLDVTVREFTMIRGYQANLQWDDSVIEYNRVQMLNSTLGLTMSNFNPTTNPANLRFTWDNLNPATLANDAKLFQVCFDIIGDCASTPTSPVTFESTATSDIEFSNPDGMSIDFTLTNGSVTVLPCVEEHSCSLSGVTQPSCAGDTGSIAVSVDADNTCECNWYLNGGSTSIQTTPGNGNCNLSSVGAGNYTFELSDASGAVVCTFDQAITAPGAITTNPSKSNAGCGDTGSITINANGGTGSLSYTWVPSVSSSDSATDLAAGDYSITIFDENDCSVAVMLTVTSELDPLVLDNNSTVVMEPSCNGASDGSISPSAMGGCPPYMFAIEGGSNMDLSAGNYGVTVTDDNGTTAEGSVTLTDPALITLSESHSDETNTSMNGSITITTTNGVAPFSYMWSPDEGDTETISNLSAGMYSVTVTDANGCTASLGPIEIDNIIGTTPPIFETVTSTDLVSCFGDCSGVISSSVSGGAGTLTIVLSGASDASLMVSSSEAFSFDDLCAGNYTMTVTDTDGNTATESNIQIAEPSDLEVMINIGDDNNNCDGFIDVDVTGGTEPYTYDWINQDWDSPLVSNLCAGSYDLMVTDANGCVFTVMDIEVDPPSVIVPCWVPSKIITPNGDGKNDFFEFSCIGQRVAGLQIFDRYGREVYTNDNYDNTFDGISNSGVELGEGGYMWVLSIDLGDQGRRVDKGTLTLLKD